MQYVQSSSQFKHGTILGFRREADESKTDLDCLTLEGGTDVVPKRRYGKNTTRCVITQKRAPF